MQNFQLVFLALLFAHLLSDFPLQTNWIVENKGERISVLVFHGLIHWVLAWASLLLFASASLLSWQFHVLIGAYLAVHVLIDRLKCWLTERRGWSDEAKVFSADQGLHVATIVIAAMALTRTNPALLAHALALSPVARMHFLEVAIVYLVVIVAGGYLIRYVTKSFRSVIENETGRDALIAESELKNAGLYIGYLERLLILTAILVKSPALVGLILTGKSIARFPELKDPKFAEYFLIGTLLSICLAVLGGLLLQGMLYGAVAFS